MHLLPTRIAPALALLAAALVVAACAPEDLQAEDVPSPDAFDEGTPDDATEPQPEPDPPTGPDTAAPAEAEPARLVWVAVENDDRTVLVDLDTGELVHDIATPGGPHNVTVAPDGTAAVTVYATTDLAVIADGQAEIVTLGDRPHDVKATDEWFVVANEAGRRIELVAHDGDPGPTIELPGEPHDLAIDNDGEEAWVTLNRRDELAVVDLEDASLDRLVPTGNAPHDLLFAPDGRLWITDWTGLLLVIDGEEVVHRRELGVEAHHLVFTPEGEEAWITDHGTNELFVLDAESVETIAVIELPGAPHHVAITADGARAAVADHTNGRLLVYGVASREQIAAIDVGPGPHGVWAVPDNIP